MHTQTGSGQPACFQRGFSRPIPKWIRQFLPKINFTIFAKKAVQPGERHLSFVCLGVLLAVSVLFFCNAWVCDDAYITFRSVEQLFAGHGPRWNPHERVQAFTHPLWFLLLSLLRLLSANLFLVTIVVSYGLFLLTLWVFQRFLPTTLQWLVAMVLLAASMSFFEFTSSGLENPLSYSLVAGFLAVAVKLCQAEGQAAATDTNLFRLVLLAGCIGLCRQDLVTLIGPLLLTVGWKARHRLWHRPIRFFVVGTAPFWGWTLFSLVYYGFPFPNTAYAKLSTGYPADQLFFQGFSYLENSVRWDYVTLPLIVSAISVGLASKTAWGVSLALGLISNLIYIMKIGGDFMHGRFLSCAALVAVMLLSWFLTSKAGLISLACVAVGLSLISPLSPLKSISDSSAVKWIDNGIAHERGGYLEQTFLVYLLSEQGIEFPLGAEASKARTFRTGGIQVAINSKIGVFGYRVGTNKIVVDQFALSDPLLARLPAEFPARIGHFRRPLPTGYIDSLTTSSNQIQDPAIREYYEKIRLVTQGQLFSLERWQTIVELNLGLIPLPGRKK